MFKLKIITLGLFVVPMVVPVASLGDATLMEQEEVAAQRTGNAIKKAYRGAKDKTCTMRHGKMKCGADKIKHKAENLSDDMQADLKEEESKAN